MSDRFGRFFLPGPTEVRAEIRRAMARPLIGHRSEEFQELFSRIQSGLRYVFKTTRPVFVSTSSATGMMEAGVRCAPSGAVLALVNGAFSQRFATIAEQVGRQYDRYEVPAGEAHDPVELARLLDTKRYSAVTIVHCETSTGVLNDVPALAAVARERGVATVVDSVSAMAGAPFEFDGWNLDFALTGSQKAFALPPGLAFAAATPAFVASARASAARGLYFDLLEFEEFGAKNQTPNTPAVSLFFALDAQLDAILAEGLAARWARHNAMRECVESWVDHVRADRGIDISIPVAPSHRSPTVTTLKLPRGMDGRQLVDAVRARGYAIGAGYRDMGAGTVRIGHMGDHTVEGVSRCVKAIELSLLKLARTRT